MHFLTNFSICMLTYNDFIDSFNLDKITDINTNITITLNLILYTDSNFNIINKYIV